MHAQAWSGIIDPSRAIDWNAIAPGAPDINETRTQCGATLTPSGGDDSTQINNALASCGAHQYVLLGPGTFALANGLSLYKSNVTLRGSGPLQTILQFNGNNPCGGYYAEMCVVPTTMYYYDNPIFQPGGTNEASWTAGYSQQSTQITLSNTSGLSVGAVIILDQANDTTDTGGFYVCDVANQCRQPTQTPSYAGRTVPLNSTTMGTVNATSGSATVTWASGTAFNTTGWVGYQIVINGTCYVISSVTNSTTLVLTAPFAGTTGTYSYVANVDYNQEQVVTVTAINGNVVTITPGLFASNWRSSQSPGAWWTGPQVSGVGVENMTIDSTINTSTNWTGNVFFGDAYGCWVKNIRSVMGNRNHVWTMQSSHITVRDSYFYGTLKAAPKSYGIEQEISSGNLIENNIFHWIVSPIMAGANVGNVIAYNYSNTNYNGVTTAMSAVYVSHDAGVAYDLYEGNDFDGFFCDDFHGTGNAVTFFRNWLTGIDTGKTSATNPINLVANCRAYNVIGNVLGTAGYHNTYQVNTPASGISYTVPANCYTSIYTLGWESANCDYQTSTPPPYQDPLVPASLLRWGNYDVVNGSVQWNSSEIPTTAIPFINANPMPPSSHNLPNSLYVAAPPSFWNTRWGTQPWPATGPDVSAGSGPGGYANPNPAQTCFNNTSVDNNYNPPPMSGSTVLAFDGNWCYRPAPPTNPDAVAH
jgi:hypothetical protein